MSAVATVLLCIAAVLTLVPTAVLFCECVLALFVRRGGVAPAGAPPRVAILVPAHDEAAIIERTTLALLPELNPGDRLVVVADNCTDATAAVARAAGAEVLERHDPERRGKGYALAFGVDALRSAPPLVVVVVDADCTFAPGSVAVLAQQVAATSRPAQARNTVVPPPEASPLAALSAFAFLLKNVVRTSGLLRLGLPCPLLGTGMAFPWRILADAPLATGALAEDLQLGVDLALSGSAPRLCLGAQVTSPMPAQRRASLEQRRRWEYGHLATLLGRAPRLFLAALRRGRPAFAAMALDLCVPPLSLLVLGWGALLTLALVAFALGTSFLPALLLGVAGGLLAASIGIAWAGFGRSTLPLSKLALAPLYVLRKVPMYFGFLRRRRRTWVRTERDPPSARQPGP